MAMSKKDYLKDVEQTLQKWAARVEELTIQAKSAPPERQRDLQSIIDAIAQNRQFIEIQVKAIKKSDESWLGLKESVEGAAKNLDDNYRSALAYIM